MEHEDLVLSFMEVSNLPIDQAKTFLEQSGYNLELAIQNYYDQQQEATESAPGPSTQRELVNYEEDVRAVIPREYDVLVEDNTRSIQLSRVRQQFSSFRDLKREMEIQEELASGKVPKRKCLEDIYRNPIDIIMNFDFTYAKHYGTQVGKWIAVLINNESFESLSFNRDIFNEPSQKAKQLLKKNFIFLRKNSNDDEGLKIMQLYNLSTHTIPILLIIDSLTGELKKNFGDCTKVTLKVIVKELKKYTSSKDKQLIYNSSYEDSDDSLDVPLYSATLLPTTSQANSEQSKNKTTTAISTKYTESDEESFASLNSNDVSGDDDDIKAEAQEGEIDEAKVLDSDDELLKSEDEPQTNILLKFHDENHKFKYPSNRKVRNLINYIYRNYLVQTRIYDNKTKRFSLFSKIHNKCLTALDQEKSLKEANIHPSIVLLHNTLDKD